MRVLIALLVVLAMVARGETVYHCVDEQGGEIYTDEPCPGAEPVELPEANITPGVQVSPQQRPGPEGRAAFEGYRRLAITEPQRIVPNGLAQVALTVELEPELQSGHQVRVLLDGRVIASGAQTELTLGQLPRGDHELEVQVLGGAEKRVLTSTTQKIFVYWPGGANR